MFNNLIGKNKELGRFLFCERYTLPPVKNAIYIAEGQDLKRGAVVDVNGVLVGTNSLMPYAVLEFDCDTRSGGKEASVFIKGEFNFDKLTFADGLYQSDLDNIVYNGNGLGIVIKPYEYAEGFIPLMVPAGTSQSNPLMNAAEIEFMILEKITPAANTLRFSFSKLDYSPVVAGVGSSGTWKKVSAKFHNVWDWTKTSNVWTNAFSSAFTSEDNLVKVIAAGDTSNITHFVSTFASCTSLVELCLFDMAGTKEISSFARNCSKLRKIPPFKTNIVTSAYQAFYGCVAVETGALDMYTTLSTQSTPPSTTSGCFTNCGSNTTTGAAELAQIPQSWGGTAPESLNMGAPQNLTEPLSPSVIEGDDSLTK